MTEQIWSRVCARFSEPRHDDLLFQVQHFRSHLTLVKESAKTPTLPGPSCQVTTSVALVIHPELA